MRKPYRSAVVSARSRSSDADGYRLFRKTGGARRLRGLRSLLAAVLLVVGASTTAGAACQRGIYGPDENNFVVLGSSAGTPASGQRFLFRDGLRGSTGDQASGVSCDDGIVTYRTADGRARRWTRLATSETPTNFHSAGTTLSGLLIEPPGPSGRRHPLVVFVHGSEKSPAIGGIYPYMLAAQGISVFVYDKRGTGSSDGDYTQNFELLADDAAAALAEARRLANGRFDRAGYFGGSQGGWVAPLAASRSEADFVAVGFGLVVSPVEEDREQLLAEAKALGLDAVATAQIERLSRATSRLVRTHFAEGFSELATVRREIGAAPWASTIMGEYSGALLRMEEAELRRIGRARFDNLELIWDYDAVAALGKLTVPLLWVLASEDREAPIAATRSALTGLVASGQPIDIYLFPGTDHGMVEFRENADGTRTPLRITDGYFKLLADWIKLEVRGGYGRGHPLR